VPLTRAAVEENALRLPVWPGLAVLLEARFMRAACMAFLIYIASAMVANEWLYLLASGFITILVIAICIPLVEVLDPEVEVSMPEGLMVEQNAQVQLRLRRKFIFRFLSWLIPLRFLRIRLDMVRRPLPGQMEETAIDPEPMLIDSIIDEVWLGIPLPKLRRGIYQLRRIEIMSCYPFGLAWCKRTVVPKADIHGQPLTIAVHPKSLAVEGNFLQNLRGTSSSLGFSTSDSISVIQSTSVRGVREFRVGDSIRHIHWPSTARLGKLLVREFDSESLPVYDLLLDLHADWQGREQFELAVSVFYSLVHHSYKQGRLPEIYFNPPLESELIQQVLMYDLPKLPPGMQGVAEILARVEPLNMLDVQDRLLHTASDRERLGLERDVVAPIPSSKPNLDNLNEHDVSLYPIEVVVMPHYWQETDEIIQEALKTSSPVKVLASVDRESDLATL
jgi:hypothetical protein